jgi:hypothetical protein
MILPKIVWFFSVMIVSPGWLPVEPVDVRHHIVGTPPRQSSLDSAARWNHFSRSVSFRRDPSF